ncbi:MAG: hypothetical protein AB2385_06160 [Symbiobacterium sp.]|uniref:hypothetical protein n=1 Tax=Symbiobacterium sp. TaxID=1971213 RepID=UPI00346472FD
MKIRRALAGFALVVLTAGLALVGCASPPIPVQPDGNVDPQTHTQAESQDQPVDEEDGSPMLSTGQLSLAGIALGTKGEQVQQRLAPPAEKVEPGHPRNPATVLYRYAGLEVLVQSEQDSVLSVRATQDWPGLIIGEVRWGNSLSEVTEKLQSLGKPIQGDKGPTTLTYLSADKSHGIVFVFDEANQLVEAHLTRQLPGSDYQGV